MSRSGDELFIIEARYSLARDRARGLLTLTRQRPPVDVGAIIELAGIPVPETSPPSRNTSNHRGCCRASLDHPEPAMEVLLGE